MPKIRFPHPMTLLVACVVLAMALSWVLPAGEFTRRDDPVTHRSVVVAGTYHAVPAAPVGPFQALVAIPRGLIDAADVVFLVFLVGAAFVVVDQTGVLGRGVDALVRGLHGRTWVVIPLLSVVFAAGGMLINMQEEFIALIPALLVLTRRMGYDPLVAVAVSVGSAAVGASFSPINPFQVGIAQKLAQLPLLSASGYRMVFLPVALALWIAWTLRFASRTRIEPQAAAEGEGGRMHARDVIVLLIVLATFATYVYGILKLDWGFNEMAGLFFAMGIVVGLIGGLGVGGTVDGYILGFKELVLVESKDPDAKPLPIGNLMIHNFLYFDG